MNSTRPAIIGFRQDRVGARIVGVLNTMRLSRKFGVPARFQWLSQPDGPYPELADPALFFAPDFVRAHIDVVSHAPDRDNLRDLGAEATQMNEAGFAAALARGERFYSDAAFDLTLLQGENRDDVTAQMRGVLADLQLSAPLAGSLDRMGKRLQASGQLPAAIHVRRGDILDGDPWSYTQWPSKFLPDEFLRAFASAQPGLVIAFSDTPAAVRHLAQSDPRIIPVDALLSAEVSEQSLSNSQRDVLELMLMARCGRVGSASSSAFSRAAHVVGGCEVVALPAGLAEAARLRAYDQLLDRVIGAPDSFFAPGDLAQSTFYAAAHAVHVGRVPELLGVFGNRDALLGRFPFVLRILAQSAQAAGLADDALTLATQGLAGQLMRRRDRVQCKQVVLLAQARQAASTIGAAVRTDGGEYMDELQCGFVDQVFGAKASDVGSMAALGQLILSAEGRAGRELMFPPSLATLMAVASSDRPDAPRVLPPWTYLADWEDLLPTESQRRELRRRPDIGQKLTSAAQTLATVEQALAAGLPLPKPDAEVALQMGFAAGKLTLHGRLRRSFAILNWLERARPDEAITAKRLADAFFQAGNRKKAWQWLDTAMARAPDNALLQISASLRAQAQGFSNRRADHLAAARRLWPELDIAQRLERQLKRDMSANRKRAGT